MESALGSGEIEENSVVRKFRITAGDGKSYDTQHYNLDAIISVGYRVNSVRATQFRQWATSVLRDFALRGYVLDRKRMENGVFLGEDYFDDRKVLADAGSVSAKLAKEHAEGEFEKFRPVQDLEYRSDFDKEIKGIEGASNRP